MTAPALFAPGLDRRMLMRGLAAGTAWGAIVAVALLAMSFYQCGTICLGQIVDTTALSIAAGIMAIGPLAIFRRALTAARGLRVDVVTPRLGEMVDADAPFASTPWWER